MIQATARTIVFCIAILIINANINAQSACSNAPSLTPSVSCTITTGDLQGATNAAPTGACGGATSTTTNGVWYKFTATSSNATITVNNLGTNLTTTTTYVELLNGTCPSSFTSLACQDVSTSLNVNSLVTGVTYYIRIYVTGSTTSGGNPNRRGFDICVVGSPNDECASAITLTSGTTCPSPTAGTLVSSTSSTGLPAGCEAGGTHYDVWYKFVAANTTSTVTLSSLGGNIGNPEVQLYSGSCGTLVSKSCGTTSLTSTTLSIGATYYIRVSNIGSSPASAGGFNICVTHPTPPVVVAAGRMNEVYKQTILSGSGQLQYPWDVTYGSDNYLWITESRGYKVYRMDPNTGSKTTVLDISMGSTWLPNPLDSFNVQFNSNWPQGGLAGLALHPLFLDGTGTHDYVFISYVHRSLGGSSPTGILYRNKLVRFTYNTLTGKLESPVALCDTLPGSNDHNSQRIIIAPVSVGGPNYLFYASGDMGAGQYSNRTRPNNAQNPASWEGKILRFNIEPDADAGPAAWIPNDNPYSALSAVWSIGIRNNQGFAYDPVLNILYGASHGPYSDDEINVIEPFKNYGHPLIQGFVDGNYNGNPVQGTNTSVSAGAPWTDNNGISSCPPIGNEATNKATIDASGNGLYKDPLFSAYAASQATVTNIWQTNPGNALPAPGWPTEAWSGLDIYTNTIVPGWKNSLVSASLKWGRLVRIRLDANGIATAPTNTVSDTISYFNSQNRFRDLAFSPDGKDIFVIMDNTSTTSGPGSANPVVPSCAGCVQKYTFLGYSDLSGKSTIPTSIPVTAGTANSCTTGTTVTIDNSNNNYWVPITGPDGNIMAEIFANGNVLGTVASSFYINSGAVRITNGLHYLDRNITITPQFQPSTPVKIRLYFSKAEFDAIVADGGSGVFAITDLKILKNNDPCSAIITNATTQITPAYSETHGSNGYMLQGDISSFSSFYFSSNNFTLPLDLLTFTGQLQNDVVLLNWKTENEINTSHFAIERSSDGIRFNSIGSVTANGRNITGRSFTYSFTDNDALNQSSQKLFYRLKMIDIDGKFKYSNIVAVNLPITVGNVYLSPNPVVNELKVSIASVADGKIQWKLMDNVGRVILRGSEHVTKGAGNLFSIDMNRLSAGTYYLNVKGAGNNDNAKVQKL